MESAKDSCDVRIIHQELVERAKENAVSPGSAERLATLFKALADPNRVRLLSALVTQEMCVCDIAAFLEMSESAVSHQLRYLRSLSLVRNRREGKVLYYRLADDHVQELIDVGLEHAGE